MSSNRTKHEKRIYKVKPVLSKEAQKREKDKAAFKMLHYEDRHAAKK